MLKQLRIFIAFFTGILFVLIISSCGTGKKSVYFSDIGRDDVSHKASAEYFEPLIQTDDILTVNIQTIDPRATAAVNQAGGTAGNSNLGPNDTAPNGFLVDKEGFIEMPMLGMVKVADMSTSEAKE